MSVQRKALPMNAQPRLLTKYLPEPKSQYLASDEATSVAPINLTTSNGPGNFPLEAITGLSIEDSRSHDQKTYQQNPAVRSAYDQRDSVANTPTTPFGLVESPTELHRQPLAPASLGSGSLDGDDVRSYEFEHGGDESLEIGYHDQGPPAYEGSDAIETGTSKSSTKKDRFTTALQDASIFLGGLIKHPTESNKHFTIMRHSHGLVYYKGPQTSVAITTFADQRLPLDRRYWLQMKGWTGNTGMRAKSMLRSNASWINVTPARRVRPDELPPLDERAWQRDIKKFMDKRSKALLKHQIRETAVIRIPAEAIDGYFRIILTSGDSKAQLCPSPVFRVASTSLSASSMKGASLGTLPLELSVNILQFAARQVTNSTVSPYVNQAKQQLSTVLPSVVANHGELMYDVSGAKGGVSSLNAQFDLTREATAAEAQTSQGQYTPMVRPDIVGFDSGTDAPFPIHLDGKIVRGSGRGARESGMPSANLANVPADKLGRLLGIYFGWAMVNSKDPSQIEMHSEWRHAIVSITYHHAEKTSVATSKSVRVYLIHDYDGQDFVGAKMTLTIMGYLRPMIDMTDKESFFSETVRDIEITRASLERLAWGPIQTFQRTDTAKSDRSLTNRYVDARIAVQRRMDSVPLHSVGVRTSGFGINDRGMYGNGGLYVVRDVT